MFLRYYPQGGGNNLVFRFNNCCCWWSSTRIGIWELGHRNVDTSLSAFRLIIVHFIFLCYSWRFEACMNDDALFPFLLRISLLSFFGPLNNIILVLAFVFLLNFVSGLYVLHMLDVSIFPLYKVVLTCKFCAGRGFCMCYIC